MRKILLPALLALTAALLLGCGEEDKLSPYFTRIHTSSDCGVAPLEVEFQAFVTGGNRLDGPTGANDYIEITWDFGDGGTASGSVVYHTFFDPGTYRVTLVGKDNDGDTTDPPGELTIEVRADTMDIHAAILQGGQPATSGFACDTVQFTVSAEACGYEQTSGDFDPSASYLWTVSGGESTTEYDIRQPRHAFTMADIGQREVQVVLTDLGRGLTRKTVLPFQVNARGANLFLRTTVDDNTVAQGDEVTFTVTLSNDGPFEGLDIEVSDQLPTGLTFVSANPSQGEYDPAPRTWTVGELLAGGSATMDLVASVNISGAVLTYTAWISGLSCRLDRNAANDTSHTIVRIDP